MSVVDYCSRIIISIIIIEYYDEYELLVETKM